MSLVLSERVAPKMLNKHEKQVTWKRLNTETPQHGNVSKKRTHKTNTNLRSLMVSVLLFYHKTKINNGNKTEINYAQFL